MKSFLSDYLVVFQNLTVPGFIYLLGVLILIKSITRFRLDKDILKNKELIFLVSILVIVFSFVIGLIVYLAGQEIKTIVLKSFSTNLYKKTVDLDYINNVYGVLILIRHLIISISFLTISIAIYFKKEGKVVKNLGFFIIMYFVLFLILSLAYFKIKDIVDFATEGNHFYWIWILFGIIFCFVCSLGSILMVNCRNNKN